jgi:hypothetical protein
MTKTPAQQALEIANRLSQAQITSRSEDDSDCAEVLEAINRNFWATVISVLAAHDPMKAALGDVVSDWPNINEATKNFCEQALTEAVKGDA